MQQYVDSVANGGNASSSANNKSTQQTLSEEEQRQKSITDNIASLQSQLESLYKDKTNVENQYNKDIDKELANAATQKSKASKEKDSKKKKEYQAKQKDYEAQAKALEKQKKTDVSYISNQIANLEKELAILELELNGGMQMHISTPKYAKGSKNIPYDQWAITQEKGTEYIRTGSGELITFLGEGDMVFTNEMSENLWKLAQADSSTLWNIQSPTVIMPEVTRNMESNIAVQVGDINMHGVNDPETFGQQLRDEICKNGKSTKCMAVAMGAHFQGKGIGNARLYR